MIDAGKCYCYHCGKVFSEAFYKNATMSVGALLVHGKNDRKTPRYEVEPYIPGGTVSENDRMEFVSADDWDNTDGIPNTITVRKGDGTLAKMKRGCPGKGCNATMYDTAGKVPTAVIAVVGATSAGKTTWLRAISAVGNHHSVNALPYPCALSFQSVGVTEDVNVATVEENEGNTNVLSILDKKSKRVWANVVLIDAAGEQYERFGDVEGRLRNVLLPHDDYPGMDGCIYFDSAETRKGDLDEKEFAAARTQTLAVFTRLVAALPSNVPVACVCSQADRLLKQAKPACVEDSSGNRKVSLLGKETFSERTSYRREDLLPRLIQEDLIAKASNMAFPVVGNTRGFAVQSCAQRQGPDKKDDGTPMIHEDYTKTMNLFDPLLWILHELGLFPLKYE